LPYLGIREFEASRIRIQEGDKNRVVMEKYRESLELAH
jgi:hypothetical protein